MGSECLLSSWSSPGASQACSRPSAPESLAKGWSLHEYGLRRPLLATSAVELELFTWERLPFLCLTGLAYQP